MSYFIQFFELFKVLMASTLTSKEDQAPTSSIYLHMAFPHRRKAALGGTRPVVDPACIQIDISTKSHDI